MANEAFVDTSGFYALLASADDGHREAVGILGSAARAGRRFVTTDYVLDETATLLKARGLGHRVTPLFEIVLESRVCTIEWMSRARFGEVRGLFLKHADKQWSFTDCFSFHVMRERGLVEALTKDRHFSQAGFRPLLRSE